MNSLVYQLLVGGFSLRRSARVLKLNRKTVVRKFVFMGTRAQSLLPVVNNLYPKSHTFEFDDLETSEHTKLKPLSVTLAVEHKTRRILGFRVGQMPAKGKIAALSRKKYGRRPDEREQARESLFSEIKPFVAASALIKSDENPSYPLDVKRHFPKAHHRTILGRRARVAGLGELKKGGFDPLFSLNHTCAMFRANINRLFRKTWCTTKKRDRLGLHIALYCLYHNEVLIAD